MDDIIKMRDGLREAADVLDEIVNLGESVDSEKKEELFGKFMIKMLRLQNILG